MGLCSCLWGWPSSPILTGKLKRSFPSFSENKKLYPVQSLSLYMQRTRQLRGENTPLFIVKIKPHLPVSLPTIARWLKKVISDSVIVFGILKAHSVRSECTSAASNLGVTKENLLKAADWNASSSFQRFYYKPVHNATYTHVW